MRFVNSPIGRNAANGLLALNTRGNQKSLSWMALQSNAGARYQNGGRVPRRQGFTLIELVVVIVMLTVMLSLTGTTFYLLLRAEKGVSQSFVTERTISKLAIQFREDVHQAAISDWSGEEAAMTQTLTLKNDRGNTILYKVTPNGLSRNHFEHDVILGREDFLLPECEILFEPNKGGLGSLRSLVIQRPGAIVIKNQQIPPPLRSLRIEAHLNRPGSLREQTVPPKGAVSTTKPADTVEDLK